jgi:hypothetical protein
MSALKHRMKIFCQPIAPNISLMIEAATMNTVRPYIEDHHVRFLGRHGKYRGINTEIFMQKFGNGNRYSLSGNMLQNQYIVVSKTYVHELTPIGLASASSPDCATSASTPQPYYPFDISIALAIVEWILTTLHHIFQPASPI